MVHVALGDQDQAMVWLERGLAARSSLSVFHRLERRLDLLRADPRFRALMERMGLGAGSTPSPGSR